MLLRKFSLALALTVLAVSSQSFAQSYDVLEPLNDSQAERLELLSIGKDTPVENFGVVDKGLYRSAAPKSLAEMKALAKMGVKTIINMQGDEKKTAQEAAWAKAVGMKHVSLPLSGFWAPKEATVQKIQKLMNDKSARPLLFHCAHGRERTGVQAGLYRVFTQKWSPKAAYKEMKDYGFRPIVFAMKDYFEKKTKTDL
jgi:protein tyrosine/serine phosphatase